MANVQANLASGLIDSLLADSSTIASLNNMTPAQIISNYAGITLSKTQAISGNRIAKTNCSMNNVTDQSKIDNYTAIGLRFDVWYGLMSYYLESLKEPGATASYKVAMVATLLGGNISYLDTTNRAYIIGSTDRVAPYVSAYSIYPNLHSGLVGNITNSKLASGSASFGYNVPTALNGSIFTLQLINQDGSLFASSSESTVVNGLVTFNFSQLSPIVDNIYTFKIVGTIFNVNSYPYLTRSITFAELAKVGAGINSAFLVGV